MKGNMLKGTVLALAVVGACLVTGCSNCAEVAEQTTTTYGVDGATTLQKVEAVESLEPVGEECPIAAPLTITTPTDRYFDPLTRSWERPYPFGPYGTANWR